ncbi:magnesium-translocating P-type ATPase [Exiguobacterium sp. SH0S1]|uniref:magnesium-translocating P-type ATPase n=1 Tax=Exiguobacterium sp. SH0S1 TaxID=2510949 RepID=UPI0013755D97|nr:magnesium-translocating P-type ATPase [Exiguobacterium sp. SH0S1]
MPADGILLTSEHCFVNQSMLTGESGAVKKQVGVTAPDQSLEQRFNCVYMGTSVQSGNAAMLVVHTGRTTEYGEIAKRLTLRPPETEFERGIRHFGYLLTRIMLVLTLVVFAINVWFERDVIDSLLFAVALAVGITPQLLSAIISITLSQGSRAMAQEGVIVRKLTAIENFGGMDVLCTDKTGTLTEGQIRIDDAVDASGVSSEEVFRATYLNATLQTGMKNDLDDMIRRHRQIDVAAVTRLGEVPFDFMRERLSVIVQDGQDVRMLAKGAFHSVLDTCDHVWKHATSHPLDSFARMELEVQFENWSAEGIRVLGVAEKRVTIREEYSVDDETGMTFIGFLLIFDHPKADVAETIRQLAVYGVDLRIITGDNASIALHTAEAVGLQVTGILTGKDLVRMSDEALWQKIETTTLFAEVDPNQKERIILALKKNGHVVGYMGDGINDVPALHAADVSLTVENAVDIAKESADLVLVRKSLRVLLRGIVLGRTTFANTLKYIMVTTSANFGNMFSMAGASLFLPFLPLLPKQILMINFLSDFPALAISQDRVDTEDVRVPRRWDLKEVRRFMIVFGLVSSLFDYTVFLVLIVLFNANESVFQSGWFVFSILTELLILMIMRTRRILYHSRPAPILLFASILVGAVAIVVPYLPNASLLGLYPLPFPILFTLLGLLIGYVLLNEAVKRWFYRKT